MLINSNTLYKFVIIKDTALSISKSLHTKKSKKLLDYVKILRYVDILELVCPWKQVYILSYTLETYWMT